MFMVRDRFKN